MEELPKEILIHGLIPKLSDKELQNLCSSNLQFSRICSLDSIWKMRTLQKFPQKGMKPSKISWREWYSKISRIPVYYHGDRIKYVHYDPQYP